MITLTTASLFLLSFAFLRELRAPRKTKDNGPVSMDQTLALNLTKKSELICPLWGNAKHSKHISSWVLVLMPLCSKLCRRISTSDKTKRPLWGKKDSKWQHSLWQGPQSRRGKQTPEKHSNLRRQAPSTEILASSWSNSQQVVFKR